MKIFSIPQVNKFILKKQNLTSESKERSIIKVATNIVGLHSTNQATPYLSLYARMENFKKNHLDEEAYIKKNFGKVRGMRTTVFLFPKEVISHIYAATKNLYESRFDSYLERLGYSQKTFWDTLQEIKKILSGKELSTSEIKKILNSNLDISAIINLACDKQELIRNKPVKSWRDKRNTYSIFQEYFPELDLNYVFEEEGREFLVKYYLERYGPVTENDICWWTGLNKVPVRKAIETFEDKLLKVRIEGLSHEFLILKTDLKEIESHKDEGQIINILPDLDPYLMGFKDRERYINKERYNYTFDRSGNATTSIVVNGVIEGVWDYISSKKEEVYYYLYKNQPENVKKGIIEELFKVGEFIFDSEVSLKECKVMQPLASRTPGEVLTPLKNC